MAAKSVTSDDKVKRISLKLKLRAAEIVTSIPEINKGSSVTNLPEYQDVQDIVAAVKENAAPPSETFKVFDLQEVLKRQPELKKVRMLAPMFALKVRRLLAHEEVTKFLRLEKRQDTYYLAARR